MSVANGTAGYTSKRARLLIPTRSMTRVTSHKIKEDAKRNKLALAHGLGLFSGVADDGGVGRAMQQQQQQMQMQHQMH